MNYTCKLEDGTKIKNFIVRSDNTDIVIEQLAGVNASEFHYRTYFRPQILIPDVDFQGSSEELLENQNTNG